MSTVARRIITMSAASLIAFGGCLLATEWLGYRAAAGRALDSGLKFSSDVCDLGTALRQNGTYPARLELYNCGSDEVRIVRFEVQCGCTVLASDRKVLPPGTSTEVAVKYDTGLGRGAFTKECAVVYRRSKEPTERHFRFAVSGTIIPEFDVTPPIVAFDRAVAGKAEVVFTANRDAQLDVSVAGISAAGLHATALGHVSGDRVQKVDISFSPDRYLAGTSTAKVNIATGNSTQPTFTVQVLVR